MSKYSLTGQSPSTYKDSMNIATKIVNTVGRSAIKRALGVSESAISQAKTDGYFPASWFSEIQRLCRGRMACPHEAFNMKKRKDKPKDSE